ncbi:hypothetical protein H9Y04_44120 [Streptomyces sp. TRM66268-LWL]|uniref:Uncharacterized protein n=1 Tax=Streptomyces polyasparticus TaxID=2767826 RepID=A0ABR7SVG5_9ACTN|nr:hypothetical protein [Streptomyces polyasparticus]MBC9719509.1 hypothetical protein [Streptomyces polyasparticus]
MAGFGPPPSSNKRRRNADTFEADAVAVPARAQSDAPQLPGVEEYSSRTRVWYATWQQAPHAAVFTVTDWQRLHMLAPLIEAYWAEPSTKLLSEIRLNESLLGATHVDRMRGRIKVEQPRSAAPPAGVADLTARRRKVSDASQC